jgi:biotin synthase
MQEAKDRGCYVALFAFTPVRGTKLDLPAPDIGRYRAIQLARYLIMAGRARVKDIDFVDGRITQIRAARIEIERAMSTGLPFRTSGCPDCNRPLYNERPRGAMYNYATPLTEEEREQARLELAAYLDIGRGAISRQPGR